MGWLTGKELENITGVVVKVHNDTHVLYKGHALCSQVYKFPDEHCLLTHSVIEWHRQKSIPILIVKRENCSPRDKGSPYYVQLFDIRSYHNKIEKPSSFGFEGMRKQYGLYINYHTYDCVVYKEYNQFDNSYIFRVQGPISGETYKRKFFECDIVNADLQFSIEGWLSSIVDKEQTIEPKHLKVAWDKVPEYGEKKSQSPIDKLYQEMKDWCNVGL